MHQMTRVRFIALTALLALCTARPAWAQSKATTSDAIVVSPAWLSQQGC
jgi:hypothetical protein